MILSHLVGVNALGQVYREVQQYAARPLLSLDKKHNVLFIEFDFYL